jgi:Zn finger protein HypA/HybF involved in hydrogenase expression
MSDAYSSLRRKDLKVRDLKPPRQREIECSKCKCKFRSSLLGVAYCPKCHTAVKLEPGFSPTR